MDAERDIWNWEPNLLPIETYARNLSPDIIPNASTNEKETVPNGDEAADDQTQESIATA